MLKRFVVIGALLAFPLLAACGNQGSGPGQSASPAATPADQQPSSQPGQPAGQAPAQPTGQAPVQPAGQPAGQAATPPARQQSGPSATRPGQPSNLTATGTQPPAAGEAGNPSSKTAESLPEFREVTIPAGTLVPVELQTPVSSVSSNVEDAVRATVRRAVTIDGYEAIPAGSTLRGVVTDVQRSGRVKGLAHVALRFNSLEARDERLDVQTGTVARTAPATKKEDATKIGIGAGAGAVIGGIVGGGSGAAKGAAIGGAGGTGAVLATRGKEVSLPSGANLSVKLTAPVTVRVPVRR